MKSLEWRLWTGSLGLTGDESELLQSVLQLVLVGVVSVLETSLLLPQELHFFIDFVIATLFSFQVHRRSDLLAFKGLPVEVPEKLVLLDLLESNTPLWPLVQQLIQQVLALLRYVLWNLKLRTPNAVVQFFDVLCVVWREANQKLVEYSSNLVNIS